MWQMFQGSCGNTGGKMIKWAIIITCLSFLLNGCLPATQVRPSPVIAESPDYSRMIQDFVNAEWEDGEPYAIYSIEFIGAQFIPQGKGSYLYYDVEISHGTEIIDAFAAFWALLDDEEHPKLRGVYPVGTKMGI